MDVGVKRRNELDEWKPRDPIARLRRRLVEERGRVAGEFDAIEEEVKAEVADALRFAEASPPPEESELLDHVYAAREEET